MSYDIRAILCPVECAFWRVVVRAVLVSVSRLFRGMGGAGVWGVEGDDVSVLWLLLLVPDGMW
jgi:hypothetical protein